MGNIPANLKTKYATELTYDEEIAQYLTDVTVSDIKGLEKQNLLAFSADTEIKECFHKLIENNVHSAPVFDPSSKEWLGLIDWKDLGYYVLTMCGLNDNVSEEEALKMLDNQSATSVVDLSRLNAFFPIFHDSTLSDAFKSMASGRVHRRPIIDPKADSPTILAMLSQMDLINWIWQNKEKMQEVLNNKTAEIVEVEEEKLVHKLGLVLSVGPDMKMLQVLKLMLDNGVNGVGVVDESSGKLIGNISASDLKYLVEENFENMLLSVKEFIKKVEHKPLVTLTPLATLMDVIEKVVENKVYRVYIVDEQTGAPLAVLSLTDIINAIVIITTKENERNNLIIAE